MQPTGIKLILGKIFFTQEVSDVRDKEPTRLIVTPRRTSKWENNKCANTGFLNRLAMDPHLNKYTGC